MMNPYDVLIVGAGAAGLAAGRILAEAGVRTAILEARDRVGGRIHTRRVVPDAGGPAIPIELGAEFVHGLPRATWDLAEEAELAAYEVDGSVLSFAHGRWSGGKGRPSVSHDVLERMVEWLARQPPGFDATFAEYLKLTALDAPSAEEAANYVEGFNAADQNRIGIAALAKQQRAEDLIEADRVFRLAQGYDAIPQFLAGAFCRAGGALRLGTAVRRIDWKPGEVLIHARDAAGAPLQIQGSRTLITAPLGVLQADTIDFAPRPEEILAQARRLAMGPALRVSLLFRSRFWGAEREFSVPERVGRELDDLSFLFTPADVLRTWWTPMPDRTPTITAWAGGRRAAALRAMTDGGVPAVVRLCLSTLAQVFGLPVSALEKLLIGGYTHDWLSDEYARGAYSYVPAGALDAPERMTYPVENTLYFAGEHTDLSGHWGTVHAALESGSLAARRILASAARSA